MAHNVGDSMTRSSGYTHCPCRDCFEISMDGKLCRDCAEHDCDAGGESECLNPSAYGCADYSRLRDEEG